MSSEHDVHEPRRLGRPSTLDREGALLAARAMIARRGLERTRYADVAEAAGVPVTTLQHAFGSLGALLLEAISVATASEISVLQELSRSETLTPWQRVQAFITHAVHPPDDPDSYLLWLEFWRLAGRDSEVGAQAAEVYEQWWSYVEELLRDGREQGEFSSPILDDLRNAAIALVGIIDGVSTALVVRADGPDYERARQVSIAAAASMLGVREG